MKMGIKTIKNYLLTWTDFYGGDIPDKDSIKNAKTESDLADILDKHKRLMEDALADAKQHLDLFKRDLGL